MLFRKSCHSEKPNLDPNMLDNAVRQRPTKRRFGHRAHRVKKEEENLVTIQYWRGSRIDLCVLMQTKPKGGEKKS